MNNPTPYTQYDEAVCNHSLNIIKASLPLFPANSRYLLGSYVKFMEFSNALNLSRTNSDFSICEEPSNYSMSNSLEIIKNYLTPNELNICENVINTINTINTYNELLR